MYCGVLKGVFRNYLRCPVADLVEALVQENRKDTLIFTPDDLRGCKCRCSAALVDTLLRAALEAGGQRGPHKLLMSSVHFKVPPLLVSHVWIISCKKSNLMLESTPNQMTFTEKKHQAKQKSFLSCFNMLRAQLPLNDVTVQVEQQLETNSSASQLMPRSLVIYSGPGPDIQLEPASNTAESPGSLRRARPPAECRVGSLRSAGETKTVASVQLPSVDDS
eukprot:g19700.t1